VQLEDYWGVGPKTAATLREHLGEPAAIEAIETADSRALVDAGVSPGRALRILRRAGDDAGMGLLVTRDATSVYRDVIDRAASFAVTRRAADRIRVLTPLTDEGAIADRLERVTTARETWESLDEGTREAVLSAYDDHEEVDDAEVAAAETALALRDAGVAAVGDPFAPLADLDADALADAARALRALSPDGVAEGADDDLDRLRRDLGAVEDLAADATGVAEAVRGEARDAGDFRGALRRHVVSETGVDAATVEEAMPAEAADATAFVTEALRALADALRTRVDEREAEVRAALEADVEDAREDVARAVDVVGDVALSVSLARFASAFDLRAPRFVPGPALAVREARHLGLVAGGEAVQPVTYAVGDHSLAGPDTPPTGDRVAVLTGANSGGKTTLLETLCQVAVLAHMGLPVPAADAEVALLDGIVLHRRHASFNAGVLESTLRDVVPPVTREGRTLMLVDEFEAITEPGSAADLLGGLVRLTVEREAVGAFVTHLADDLEPLPDAARVDGIFAEGLTDDLDLEVDYQPRFGTVGQSTPEFIVSRLVAQARDPSARRGFEVLGEALGNQVVQQTLTDVDWTADG
jgi:hypothetical protein